MGSDTGRSFLDRTVGELVSEDYARAATFTELGIDFCCGGGRTLAEACEAAGVAPARAVRALGQATTPSRDPAADPRMWSLERLAGHIEKVHHAYVRRTLPVLGRWTDRVAQVHGTAHPELLEVRALVAELAEELERHMTEEETALFPQVARLEDPAEFGGRGPDAGEDGLALLEDEHEHAGALTRRIRALTRDYLPPSDACATYAATLHLLREFEADLHRHVHLENNVLFPRARALHERRVTDDGAPH